MYTINRHEIRAITNKMDLRVQICNNLKVEYQCTSTAVNKQNRILGIISRNFVYKNKENLLRLHKSLVRPHLEYCVQAW